jgi:hypothetical protein
MPCPYGLELMLQPTRKSLSPLVDILAMAYKVDNEKTFFLLEFIY